MSTAIVTLYFSSIYPRYKLFYTYLKDKYYASVAARHI